MGTYEVASDAQACAMIALKHMKVLSLPTLSDIAKSFGYDLGILSPNGAETMSEFKRYEHSGDYSREKGSNSSKDVLPDREVNLGSDLFGKNIADFVTRLDE